ncbi:hypothetical protein FRIG_09070, partial [Frigoribacterium faeni]|uniref:hypothetical protein n=1 Tax=Frigoribacterium faeni TaxID=145483 RepID=UPI001FAD2E7A
MAGGTTTVARTVLSTSTIGDEPASVEASSGEAADDSEVVASSRDDARPPRRPLRAPRPRFGSSPEVDESSVDDLSLIHIRRWRRRVLWVDVGVLP